MKNVKEIIIVIAFAIAGLATYIFDIHSVLKSAIGGALYGFSFSLFYYIIKFDGVK